MNEATLTLPRVIRWAHCTHCGGGVELECTGLQGVWGYETWEEYLCPHCRKQNHQKCPGSIVAVRIGEAPERRAAG